jgi:hypothetical protein
MVVEQRIYTLKAEYTPAQYIAAYEELGMALQIRHLGNLIGYFISEIGTLNQLIFLWGYESFPERGRRRAALAAEPQWENYLAKVRPMLQSMENRLLVPAASSPLR